MTAVTFEQEIFNGDPGVELVLVTVTDGYTYVSKKFGKVIAAHAQHQTDADGYVNCTCSGATVTINAASASGVSMLLTVYGTL